MSDAADDARVLDLLEKSFLNLGATREQACIMAGQTLKRARQIAVERGIPEGQAMAQLLDKMMAGRRGNYTGAPPAAENENDAG